MLVLAVVRLCSCVHCVHVLMLVLAVVACVTVFLYALYTCVCVVLQVHHVDVGQCMLKGNDVVVTQSADSISEFEAMPPVV